MTLARLRTIVQPPSEPAQGVSTAGWQETEQRLGSPLPEDYREFVAAYGAGKIDDFIVVFTPFASNPMINLIEWAETDREGLGELHNNHELHYPLERYPAAGGLLPFASTDNGDMVYWRTSGEPDRWPVVVYESRGPEYEEFEGSMTQFLAAILDGSWTSRIIPDLSDEPRHVFLPYE